MSYSTQVKSELCGRFGDRHCNIAEIAAIVHTCGDILYDDEASSYVRVHTENAGVAKKYFTLVKKTFNINCEVLIRYNKQFKKNRLYCLHLENSEAARKLMLAAGLVVREEKKGEGEGEAQRKKQANALVVNSDCCRRAYIRGAFISGGSLTNPEKTYHLEFVNSDRQLSMLLMELIHSFGLNAKMIRRKTHFVVYLKEGENIVDLLNVMGATLSLMNFENVRIVKDMRNTVNRIVNCETANISKTVSAAVKQAQDIQYISDKKGLGYLSWQLEEVARLRLSYPEASLKEIGLMLTPVVSKSGVNHRLRKISEIAENLRGD